MTKSEFRSIFRDKRRELSSAEQALKSNAVVDGFFNGINLTSIKKLHCFISIPGKSEVATGTIFDRIWREFPDVETFVPRIDRAADKLEAVRYTSSTVLAANDWKIREPAGDDVADPDSIDLVIVPLLCFDRIGHRVGYGKGYYDWFLKKCRPDCIKAGLSFFPPVDRIEDLHAGDIPLDVCFTPDSTYRFERAT
jgi:5-formyltetrahydrofolate cyclo-ligase